MLSSSKKRTRLTEAKSLQEATNILTARKAHPAVKSMVHTAFRVNDDKEKLAMLQEAEKILEADERALAESIKVAPGDNNRVSGQSAQSDGQTLDDIKEKNPTGTEGSRPAQSIPGVSQLQEMVDAGIGTMGSTMGASGPQQTADMGSVDPMNICVIEKMSQGMSEVEAQNACTREIQFSEAIVKRAIGKLPEILKKVAENQAALAEAIQIVQNDSKNKGIINLYDNKSKQGFAEGVIPGMTEIPKVPLDTPEQIESFKKDFNNRYIQ